MKAPALNKLARFISFSLAAVTLAGFGSCSVSVQDVCMRRLPEFDDRISGALATLAPASPQGARGLASVLSEIQMRQGPLNDLAPAEREFWLGWAEQRLAEAQWYIDAIDGHHGQKAVQRELSDIATALVAFHGYARQGRGDRMVKTLERIQTRSAKARSLVCTPDNVASR